MFRIVQFGETQCNMSLSEYILSHFYIFGPPALGLAAILIKNFSSEEEIWFVSNELTLSTLAAVLAPIISSRTGMSARQINTIGASIIAFLFVTGFCIILTKSVIHNKERRVLRFFTLGVLANGIAMISFGGALYIVKEVLGKN
jgi:hypothetical protein